MLWKLTKGWYNQVMEKTLNTLKNMSAVGLKNQAIASFENDGYTREEAIKIVNSVDHSKSVYSPEAEF